MRIADLLPAPHIDGHLAGSCGTSASSPPCSNSYAARTADQQWQPMIRARQRQASPPPPQPMLSSCPSSFCLPLRGSPWRLPRLLHLVGAPRAWAVLERFHRCRWRQPHQSDQHLPPILPAPGGPNVKLVSSRSSQQVSVQPCGCGHQCPHEWARARTLTVNSRDQSLWSRGKIRVHTPADSNLREPKTARAQALTARAQALNTSLTLA